jgi:hypothetical protein
MFKPTHGIHVTDGRKTYRILICYHSRTLVAWDENGVVGFAGFYGTSDLLDNLLRAAHVPVPSHRD